jgi:hypothetical protein
MKKRVVFFVINKDLDIKNHLIGLDSYKNKLHSRTKQKNEFYDKLLKLSSKKRRAAIRKNIGRFYLPEKCKFLNSIAKDVNSEWAKIETVYFKRLEKIHKHPFPFSSVKAVLSSAGRFGYNTDGRWFAASMLQNKFASIDIATHELMHFMFHKYYWKVCEKSGLSWKQIWNIKEAFTVLLNIEFSDIRFQPDNGYPEHKKIRTAIENSWKQNRAFNKALSVAINTAKLSS